MGEQEIQVEAFGKRVILGEEKTGTESAPFRALGKGLQVWLSIAKSHMKGDFQVRFRERLRVKSTRPTRLCVGGVWRLGERNQRLSD